MSRLRKLKKIEGQRRSPRISALEAEAHGHSASQGPAFRTRGRKNTNLRPLQQLTPSPNQVVKHSRHQDIQKETGDDKPSKLPSSTVLPEKRILQLVLDTLQRRDTYEIFAEPVDQNEVEDYYAIIKEPMDFGTMRAKLHEGMYKSLEQFELDVFLIFDNAMQFNSSGTIYFRQARIINELAKKVFDLLRNNPEKFELEFSETRRKVGRKNQGDFRDSTDLKSSEIAIGVPSKTLPCSSRGTSIRKIFMANDGCSDIAKDVEARHVESIAGTKGSSRCRSFEIDKRCTYKPLSLEKDKSIFSTVYGKLKFLKHVSHVYSPCVMRQ
ncbi:bromodomain-containing factor 1 [Cajanus cajan]|uniref:bromodomain-containing factor 1 n=1 Tax=Cajanus cajan TaxID=3821 RepID=UPI0010FB1704|nr:bromodomain-containing factor 1 [Cajanus cajan]